MSRGQDFSGNLLFFWGEVYIEFSSFLKSLRLKDVGY